MSPAIERINIPAFLAQYPDRVAIVVIAALFVAWLVRRSWRRWRTSAAAGRPLWRRVFSTFVTAVVVVIITLIGWSVGLNGVGTTLFLISWFTIIATELMGVTVSP